MVELQETDARIRLEGAAEALEAAVDDLKTLTALLEVGWQRRLPWQRELIARVTTTDGSLGELVERVREQAVFEGLVARAVASRGACLLAARAAWKGLTQTESELPLGQLVARLCERAPVELGVINNRPGWLFGATLFGVATALAISREPLVIAGCVAAMLFGIAYWLSQADERWEVSERGIQIFEKKEVTLKFSELTRISVELRAVAVRIPDGVYELATDRPVVVADTIRALQNGLSAHPRVSRSEDAVVADAVIDGRRGIALVTRGGIVFGSPRLGVTGDLHTVFTELALRDDAAILAFAQTLDSNAVSAWSADRCGLKPDGALEVGDAHLELSCSPAERQRVARWFAA